MKDALRDRHNRLLGQVYLGNKWIQGELLRNGYAMTHSFADTPSDLARRMLAEEQAARKEKKGLWAFEQYRIIHPEEANSFINHFKIIEGKVTRVHAVHGNVYINFFEAWRGKFAVYISRRNTDAFTALSSLTGKTIRVRGWLHYHNAPMLTITHPAQLELVE